jgi:hypothetical protein
MKTGVVEYYDFGFWNADCEQFAGTAEPQRAQSKPNEDSLTSKK